MAKSPNAFRTISEVSAEVGVPQHVLRFWETKFSQVKPMKRGGGRRYYRPEDVALLRAINKLLYTDGLTIKGVQKLLREQGVKAVSDGAATAVDAVSASAAAGGGSVKAAKPAEMSAEFLRDIRAVRERLNRALEAARV